MTKLAVQEFFPSDLPIKVNDIEIKNGVMIPTYFLIKRLEKENPDKEFYFVLGSDLIPNLKLWDEGPKLITEVKFIIFQREVFYNRVMKI